MLLKLVCLFCSSYNTGRETLEFHYFYASNNEQLLKSPHLIGDQQDLQNLLNHLAAKDFPSLLKEQRPNTKWVIEPHGGNLSP